MTDVSTKRQEEKSRAWQFFTSMQMAIILLFVLGAAASLGTLIPQGEPDLYYTGIYGGFLGRIILFSGMDRLYSCWWFLALGTVFCMNLLVCSFKRWKNVRQWPEYGSVLIHLSVLVIVAGSLFSALTGIDRYLELAPGETADLTPWGLSGYTLTVNDFAITYYDDQTPQQYQCDLVVAGPGGISRAARIMVNHPLRFQGLKIYQQSYGWQVGGTVGKTGASSPFKVKAGEAIVLDADQGISLKTIFIPDFDEQTQSLQTKSPQSNHPVLACAVMQANQLLGMDFLRPGEQREIGAYTFSFTEYGYYSGLNIKKDPGTKVVFSGFFLMTIGFILRYGFTGKAVKGGA